MRILISLINRVKKSIEGILMVKLKVHARINQVVSGSFERFWILVMT